MDFKDVLYKFEFLFTDENNIEKDMELTKQNVHLCSDRQKYTDLSAQYLERTISEMAPITLLTNLGLISIGESLGLVINERRINQFEIDFLMALVIKNCKMKLSYNLECGQEEINILLKAINIYLFCTDHDLHKNSMDALVINNRYRINRIVGFDEEKLDIINEFFRKYDKTTDVNKIKITSVIKYITLLWDLIGKRLEIISGRVIYLEQQYKFFIFTPEDIKEICDKNFLDYSKVISTMYHFSCQIGDLRNIELEELYLDNPIYKKFIILIKPGLFFIPNIYVVLENLFDILKEIMIMDKHDLEKYSNTRAQYLEEKTFQIIQSKFKNAGKIYLNSQWDKQRHGENDCTLVYENYAIVFEDKSGNVNHNTNKGIMRSALKDNKKLIEESSKQATLFSELLKDNFGNILELKVKGGSENKIDLRKVNKVITIGVIFEETPLQNLTLGPSKHIPVMSIFQLDKIFKCLENAEIIDYFLKRSCIENNILYYADEYDFIYTYLINGINTTNKIYEKAGEKEKIMFPYKEGKITRNDLIRESEYQKIIDAVVSQADKHWLEKVISLLEVPPIVQKQIMRDIWIHGKLELLDNLKARDKIVVVKTLEYYDSDTDNEIENYIKEYSNFLNVLYIAFTRELKHVVVKVIKAGEKLY